MTLTEAIKQIGDGNCLLFVGSGFSFGASTIEGTPLYSASELSKRLYEVCGITENDYQLDKAAQLYSEEKGDYQLVEFLKQGFIANEVSPDHQFIGSLPWRRIYTTNYDNVIEKAYTDNRRRITTVTLSNRLHAYKDKDKLCIHLNGYIENLTYDKLYNEFKLTQSSYLNTEFVENEWVNFFRSDLKTSTAVFFIGYSMQFDLDLQRIVYENKELREKCFFVVQDGEGQLALRHISLFGQPCPIGLDGLVQEMRKNPPVKSTAKSTFPLCCFRKFVIDPSPLKVHDNDVFDLFINGKADSTKVFYSLIQPEDYAYYIHREKIDATIHFIEQGERKLLITSDLGNGKSLMLMGIMAMLTYKGYEVYEYVKDEVTLEREVETICSRENNKVVIVVDSYAHKRELMTEIERFHTDQTIIVAERSLVNDVSYTWLTQKLGEFQLIDIDRMTQQEMEDIIKLFDLYGLWGERASLRDDQKYELVRTECHANLRYFLMKILESPVIIDKFKGIIDDIKAKKGYYEALILMLLNPVFELNLELEQVAYILNKQQINNYAFRNNTSIREFVDFDHNQIRLRSTVLAEVLLRQIADKGVIADLLIKVCKSIDGYTASPSYKNIIKSLYTYSAIRQAFYDDRHDYSGYVTHYFESIKDLSFSRRNPHFWLQYAIAKLEQEDYVMAKRFFDNAYAFAKSRRDYDTYQIDNHYARYLLQNAIAQNDADTAMTAFVEAHDKLIDPVHKRVVRFYPYRVAKNYCTFYDTFYTRLKDNERLTFIRSCKEMLDRASWYLQVDDIGFSKKDMVANIKKNLEQIVSKHLEILNS